jgi:hypothetical protein
VDAADAIDGGTIEKRTAAIAIDATQRLWRCTVNPQRPSPGAIRVSVNRQMGPDIKCS